MAYPLDRLTLNPQGAPRSNMDAAVTIPGTELLGFDHLAILQWTTRTEQVGNVSRYGPSPVLVVASGNVQAIVTGVAVQFEPDSFMYRWGVWFAITRGAVQEFELQTSLAADDDLGRDYSGRIWAPIASLDEPQLVRIAVDPASTLQLVCSVGLNVLTQPLNAYVRLLGYYQTKR